MVANKNERAICPRANGKHIKLNSASRELECEEDKKKQGGGWQAAGGAFGLPSSLTESIAGLSSGALECHRRAVCFATT
jgi:hypothetical protein